MNANQTPDHPVPDAADAPASEEPSWIEIGTPKRRNAPPAWSDEATQDAWNGSGAPGESIDGVEQDSQTAATAGFELVEVPESADAAPLDSDDDVPQGSDDAAPEAPADDDSTIAPAPVDDWVQGPVAPVDAPTEPGGWAESSELVESSEPTEPTEPADATEPTELSDPTEPSEPSESTVSTEQLEIQHGPTAELEVEQAAQSTQSPAPADLEDPESGDRWHVVPDGESSRPDDGGPRPDEGAAAAPEEPRADGVTVAPVERADELDRAAAQTPAPAPAPPERPAAEDGTGSSPQAAAGASPRPATLSVALDLMGPQLQARRPALILGLVTLVVSIWMLVALPFPLKFSIDAALAVAGTTRALLIAAVGLAALVALQAGLRTLSVAILNRAGGRIATDLRGRLLSHLQRLSPGRDIDDLGSTASPLVQDVARLRDLVAHTGPRILGGLLALASLLVVTLVVEPITAAIVLVTTGLFALVASASLRRQRRLETAAAADEAVLADTADELLAATATIQSYGLEQRAESSLGDHGTRAANSRSAARRARAVGRFLTELIAGLGVGATLLVGGWRMNSGTMTPGELIMVIAYVLIAVMLVREVVEHAVVLPGTRAAAGRVGALLEHRAAITDPRRSQHIGRLRGEVVYSALSADGPHGALFDRISLVIPAGQHVALVGREGHEASALLSYLLRFEEPDTGRVLLDRFDTRVLALGDLRRQLAVVQRESALFTETVRENIRVGRPGASDDEIVEAARRSGADEFITLLPEGYDTLLARRGAGLSEGQRRRLAITRALLRDAPVVVLDGADEDLAPTEREDVRRALEILTEGRTALISGCEAEAVLTADRVVCFESGDLAEDGAPAQLAEDPDSWLASWLRAADVAAR